MKINEGFEASFLQVLIKLNYIQALEAAKLLAAYHESDINQFEDFLLSEGLLEKEQLLEALSDYYQVPSLDVIGYFFERHLLHMFPKDMLLRNQIIPYQVDQNMMIIIAAKPDNPDLLFEIGEYVSYDIRFYVGIGQDICDSVKEFYDKADTEIHRDDQDTYEDLLTGELTFKDHENIDTSISFNQEFNEHTRLEDEEEEDPFE